MYKLIKNSFTNEINSVFKIQTNTIIPFDDNNADYIEYKKWLSEGNIPDEPDTNESL